MYLTLRRCLTFILRQNRLYALRATMRFSSRNETCDTNTPSSSSSRTSINGGLRHKSSNETIQSYQGSISNSSVHTISTIQSANALKDLSDLAGQCPPPAVSHHSSESSTGQYPTIFDDKSLHSLEKPTSLFRNQSLSTICTIREPDSDCESNSSSTLPSTPKQERSSFLLNNGDEPEIYLPHTPRSSQAVAPTWAKAPSPSTGTSPSSVVAAPSPP